MILPSTARCNIYRGFVSFHFRGISMESRATSDYLKTRLCTGFMRKFMLLTSLGTLCPAQNQAQQSTPSTANSGYISSKDGIRLYYAKVGRGSNTVIMPGRLFAFRDFQSLAKGRTLIFYDMRNRGRSDRGGDCFQ